MLNPHVCYRSYLLAFFRQASPPIDDSYSISLKTLALLLLVALIATLFVSRVRKNNKWSFLVTVLSLLSIGLVFQFAKLPYLNDVFIHSLSDALIIASILAFTVDVYLKERVLREVSTDVAKYLVGYRLPEEVQNRIRSLLQTRWIRRNCSVRLRLTEIPARAGYVRIEMVVSKDVENITTEVESFQDRYTYERHLPERILEIRCDSADVSAQYQIVGPGIAVEKDDEPGVMQALGVEVKIPPVHEALGRYYRFMVRYEAEYPDNYSDILSFELPTMSVVFETEHPPGFRLSATPPDVSTPNRWEYQRLFLPGEHIRYRWERVVEDPHQRGLARL
jgi:hypothetical protein